MCESKTLLDRIQHTESLAGPFDRVENFDCRSFLIERYSGAAGGFHLEVEFQAPLSAVQQKIPASYGQLSTTATGVLLQSQYEDLPGMARYLVSLNLPFTIHHPSELRDALQRLAEQLLQVATIQPP